MLPGYQAFLLPVLKEVAKYPEIHRRELTSAVAEQCGLSQSEREELLPSGKSRRFDNRLGWAGTHLKKAGLLVAPRRGYVAVTDEGRNVLSQNLDHIDNKFLMQYDSFQDFHFRRENASENESSAVEIQGEENLTPDETLRVAHQQINSALASELLERVRAATPQFFENLIVDLLLAMNYGGTSEDAARALGQSGDNGVDGVVDQDPLGVDQIYVQAKRYAEGNHVGAGDIRDFFGALNLKKAQKGIFFTTSAFSKKAKETAEGLGTRIVLIDGPQFSKLMVQYNIGCREEETLYLKKVDDEFFEDGAL